MALPFQRVSEAHGTATTGEGANVTIRDFEEGDWKDVWSIIRQVCKDGRTFTYPRDVDEAFARQLWLVPRPGSTLVAEDTDGRIVGTAKMGPNQMGPGAHVATASFMVAEASRGKGLGRALASECIDRARRTGFAAMQFNAVVASNENAVGLWKSLDFEIVGTVPEAFRLPDGRLSDLLIMHRRLEPCPKAGGSGPH